jgi:type IV pilus assembly protein PilA
MIKSIKARMNRDEDEGFTLIELMVVLLIIAILLAIAIPTFLGARNTANARSTQENLRNALTAEQTNWTNNQTFASNLSSIESALNWTTGSVTSAGGNTVDAVMYNYASTGDTATATTGTPLPTSDSVLLVGYGKDGNCWAIFASDNPSASFTSYSKYAPTSNSCGTGGNMPTLPTAAPTAGTSASSQTTTNWYAGF